MKMKAVVVRIAAKCRPTGTITSCTFSMAAPLLLAVLMCTYGLAQSVIMVDAFAPPVTTFRSTTSTTTTANIRSINKLSMALLTSGDNSVPPTIDFGPTGPSGLSGVHNIIAVSSCKGGVGKSTTSVNLAYSLQSLGYSVGIFDADLFGPSLPTMITPDDDNVRFVGRQISPLESNGVKLMSFGYVNDGSAIMRGPMVTQLLDQFLSMVHWGDSLDYLILDMPPGTGDVQLTLTQRLNITGAVIVTTPQELSFADVVRGIEMFDAVNVPCLAVVENMAYYEVDRSKAAKGEGDGEGASRQAPRLDAAKLKSAFLEELIKSGVVAAKDGNNMDDIANGLVKVVQSQVENAAAAAKEEINGETASTAAGTDSSDKDKEIVRIFGKGHKQRLSELYGIDNTFSVPLLDRIAANGDSGVPFVLENPDSNEAAIYKSLAEAVVEEVGKIGAEGGLSRPLIQYDSKEHVITVQESGEGDESKATIPPAELRRDCRCATCVEELTGKQVLKPEDISDAVAPLGDMETYGNYAISVNWSDGHRSLYPYRQIRSLVQDLKEGRKTAGGGKSKEKTPMS